MEAAENKNVNGNCNFIDGFGEVLGVNAGPDLFLDIMNGVYGKGLAEKLHKKFTWWGKMREGVMEGRCRYYHVPFAIKFKACDAYKSGLFITDGLSVISFFYIYHPKHGANLESVLGRRHFITDDDFKFDNLVPLPSKYDGLADRIFSIGVSPVGNGVLDYGLKLRKEVIDCHYELTVRFTDERWVEK